MPSQESRHPGAEPLTPDAPPEPPLTSVSRTPSHISATAVGLRRLALTVLFLGTVTAVALWIWKPTLVAMLTGAAYDGRAPALFNIPHAEPLLKSYSSVASYERLADVGVKLACMALLAAAFAAALYTMKPALFRAQTLGTLGRRFGPACFWLACAMAGTLLINRLGFWSEWYPIDKVMAFTADPPYRHRILMPAFAHLIGRVLHANYPHTLFLATQFLTLLVLFPLTARWCALFADRKAGVLASLMLFPLLLTTHYFTFYDLGIVLFFTLGLYLLATRRVWLYLAMIPVATLNHEIILFLILVSGWLIRPWQANARYDWKFVAAQLALYAAVRSALFHALPETRASALGNIWINLHFAAIAPSLPAALFDTFILAFCSGIALFGIPHAPVFLRKSVAILVLLAGSTLFVGSLNEARQFLAFAPAAAALLVCWIRSPDAWATQRLLAEQPRRRRDDRSPA
jgi:hypothetical protein